ncbi:hypothetical protein PIB30_019748 [Stylosanthes scabra]|uniref:Uncharacterized protein n=1 Tax=Stylosanthes scabra TaxID=79078 RepID=A0ABU6W894_9FABA|nr:hypothetical protein [Stylosanthes scabra]
MKQLITEEVLGYLDFNDFDTCVDCINDPQTYGTIRKSDPNCADLIRSDEVRIGYDPIRRFEGLDSGFESYIRPPPTLSLSLSDHSHPPFQQKKTRTHPQLLGSTTTDPTHSLPSHTTNTTHSLPSHTYRSSSSYRLCLLSSLAQTRSEIHRPFASLLKPRHLCSSSRRRSTLLLPDVLLPNVLLKQHRFYRSARRVTSDSGEPPLSSRRRSTLLLVPVLLPDVLLKQHCFYRSARRVTSDSGEPPLFFTSFRCRRRLSCPCHHRFPSGFLFTARLRFVDFEMVGSTSTPKVQSGSDMRRIPTHKQSVSYN